MEHIPTLPLNNQLSIPTLGLGTWKSEPQRVGQVVESALLTSGYRHIDCAAVYGNEQEIGQVFDSVFSQGKLAREQVFITSKLWNTNHDPHDVVTACQHTLRDLQLDYLDLYLMHWGIAFVHGADPKPIGDDGLVQTAPVSIQETWQAMEQLVDAGLVKSIGVANFTAPMLVDLFTYARIQPVMNQIEIHPYNTQEALVQFCHKKQVQVTAYSPLGSTGGELKKPLDDALVIAIAQKYHRSPAQILIRWSLQRGLVVIPKSTNPDRVAQNSAVFDFELSADDMGAISQLNKNYRFVNPADWSGVPYFA